ncbi:family 20 glycosylhydrolase [Roseateles sp.]|uniref:family 20 glycosylhydrolase n=1 Tax=Roseateles sp. TaxID=1971397 RepID=UPI0039EA78CF
MADMRHILFAAAAVIVAGLARAEPPRLDLSWTLERAGVSSGAPDGQTQAVLALRNAGAAPLPVQGWSLYFTVLAGLESGAMPGGMRVEQVKGTLYRLRPAEGFPALAPGAEQRVTLRHPEILWQPAKAPQSPFVAEDAHPDAAVPAQAWRLMPIDRSRIALPADTEPLVDAGALYARYETMQPVDRIELPPVFPKPLQWQRAAGEWRLQAAPQVVAPPQLASQARQLQGWLDAVLVHQPRNGTFRLELGRVRGQSSPEAYELRITPQGATLRGATPAAVALGLQSLRQMLPTGSPAPSLALPALHLVDAPRFAYRGLLLDVARSFMTVQEVGRVLELMARLKLNTLHLHLSDDEGWRLEIAALPELTAVGAKRGLSADPLAMLPPAYASGPKAGTPPGSGHYSRAEFIALLRQAADLGITVIPEFDLPGHARAAVVAMEARHARLAASDPQAADAYRLRDPADRSRYQSAQQYDDNLMDPGLPSTYRFIDTVVGEVIGLYREAGVPLRRLHLGGDEVPAGAWQQSPASLALMQREGLKDAPALWSHFFDRIQRLVASHGVLLAGWEEMGMRAGKPDPGLAGRGVSLYVWNTTTGAEDLGLRLANAGYPTVLASARHLYFDMAHLRDPAEPGHDWAALVDLDEVFGYVPLDPARQGAVASQAKLERLTSAGRRNVLGLEATLFTETVQNATRADYMLMPRLLAMAERAWSANPPWATASPAKAPALYRADLARFLAQAGTQVLPRLDAERPDLLYRIAPPGLMRDPRDSGRVLVNYPWAGQPLRYTTDGSAPTAASPLVAGPIVSHGPVHVTAFDSRGRPGRSSQLPALNNDNAKETP